VLHGEVAVVDPAAPAGLLAPRQGVEQRRQLAVRDARAVEQRLAARLEEAAVVGRQADRRVALADRGRGSPG
jgi:hypothetical protein